MKILLLTTLSALVACGEVGHVSVTNVEPMDGYDVAFIEYTDNGPIYVRSPDVDVVPSACVDEEGECVGEWFGDHCAMVTVTNDTPADPSNPLFGKVELRGFTLRLDGITDGAPELPTLSGGIRQTILADSEESFVVVLVDPGTKFRFFDEAGYNFHQYTASYVFTGPNGVELGGATTVVFGSYMRCPEDYFPALSCN